MVKIIDVSNLKHRIKDDDFDDEKYEESIYTNLKANHGKIDNPDPKMDDKDYGDSGSDDDDECDSDSDMEDSSDDEKDKKK